MCKELEEELERGKAAARALVAHMEAMGGASQVTIPISHVAKDGRLQEWEITAELKSCFEEPDHD